MAKRVKAVLKSPRQTWDNWKSICTDSEGEMSDRELLRTIKHINKNSPETLVRQYNTDERFRRRVTKAEKAFNRPTIHQAKKVFKKYFKCRKISWLFLIIVLLFTALGQVKDRVESYLNHDTILQIKEVQKEEIEFPAVTICNFNKIFGKLDPETKEFFNHLEGLARPGYKNHALARNISDMDDAILDHFYNLTLSQYFSNVGWQLDDESLLYCKFHDRQCEAHDFIKVFTEYGSCYCKDFLK